VRPTAWALGLAWPAAQRQTPWTAAASVAVASAKSVAEAALRSFQPCLARRYAALASGTTLALACQYPQVLVQTGPLIETTPVGP